MNGFLRKWKGYFEVNAALPDGIPWSDKTMLDDAEKEWIGPSLAAFQLGESSDGRGLMAAAEACGKERGWAQLAAVTGFFVREEQKHADLLGRFLDREGMPRLAKDGTDEIFRFLRRHMGLRTILPVLLTAEVLALVYYRNLAASTGHPVLRALCRKLVADEMAHVAYEAALLEGLRKGSGAIRLALERWGHGFLYSVTSHVVYFRHREVLVRGGCPFPVFLEAARAEFARVMDPKSALAPEVPEAGSWEEQEEKDVILRWEPIMEGSMA